MARGKGSNKSVEKYCALGQNACKKPSGKISWVCCDGCSEWYHCTCVRVDPKEAANIIYFCKLCLPDKEEEFAEIKEPLKLGLAKILKSHPTFSTTPIARKYFSTKGKSDDYHNNTDGSKNVPLTLMELSSKIDKDAKTVDYFKQMSETMIERMKTHIKTDQESEIVRMSKEIEKLIVEVLTKRKNANSKKALVKGKKEPEKEKVKKEEVKPKEEKKSEVVVKPKEEKKVEVVKAREETKRGTREDETKKVSKEEKKVTKEESKKPETEIKGDHKCEMCKKKMNLPIYQCVDDHMVCQSCLDKSERGYCPNCRNDSGKNRRMKKIEKWSNIKKIDADENVKENDSTKTEKMEVDEPIKTEETQEIKTDPISKTQQVATSKSTQNATAKSQATVDLKSKPTKEAKSDQANEAPPAPVIESQKGKGGRKRRVDNVEKTDLESPPKTAKVSKPRGGRRKQETKNDLNKMDEGESSSDELTKTKLSDLADLDSMFGSGVSPILPKSLLSPITPLNLVQSANLPKGSIIQPPQVGAVQAFQLRPSTASMVQTNQSNSPRSPPQFRMTSPPQGGQVRAGVPHNFQFFKIVEGKPVQIPGSPQGQATIQPGLPTSPLPIQSNVSPGVAPKLYCVRNPTPGSPTNTMVRPQVQQRQIILLSNKDPSKAHVLTPVSPANATGGIVKLVSAGGTPDGGKLVLGPNVVRAPSQLQGPVLIRPAGAAAPLSPPLLPNVPLPRAALNSGSATNNAQTLLPKSPVPQAQMKTDKGVSSPTLGSTGPSPKPADNPLNKAFVWKNSDRTQFKLSARFNFDLFREYQKAHPLKDIRFALASIVTEDKSNEFSFHLSQQKEAVGTDSFWQLGVRAKNVSEHVWHLKVKVDSPVFLVNNGSFKQATSNFRIPKDISDRAVVDYELLLMGKASALASGAPGATNPASGLTKNSRIISKKSAMNSQPPPKQQQPI